MAILKLLNVRLAFPSIFTATTVNGEGEPAFSASFLLPPDHSQMKEIQATIEAVAKEKWADKAPAILKAMRAGDKTCLHDGDAKAQYAGFSGNFYVSSRSDASKRPLVLDRDKTPLVAADGRPYGGCFVNANLEIWAQDNAYGKRINAQLRGVQFLRDGDSFGGGSVASADEFDDLAEQGQGEEEEALA